MISKVFWRGGGNLAVHRGVLERTRQDAKARIWKRNREKKRSHQ